MSDFTIGALNHIGIAVPDLEKACDTYRTLYGATDITTPFDMPEQGVKVCFVNLPNSQIELIEPLSDASPIAKFVKENPRGGQHHVCFEVEDINEAVTAMNARGATVLGEPRKGAHGTPIIFVHPKNSDGVLIELMERPKGDH